MTLDNVKFNENGTMQLNGEDLNGRPMMSVINAEGECVKMIVDGVIATPEQLDAFNNNPAMKEANLHNYETLSSVREEVDNVATEHRARHIQNLRGLGKETHTPVKTQGGEQTLSQATQAAIRANNVGTIIFFASKSFTNCS